MYYMLMYLMYLCMSTYCWLLHGARTYLYMPVWGTSHRQWHAAFSYDLRGERERWGGEAAALSVGPRGHMPHV